MILLSLDSPSEAARPATGPRPVEGDTAFGRLDGEPSPRAAARPWTAAHGGYTLESHFQPILSLSHGRVVGHEALLRARDADDLAVPPMRFFGVADPTELLWRDRLARTVHAANYARSSPSDQWLFLNLHPQVFAQPQHSKLDHFIGRTAARFGIAPAGLVLEVLEAAVPDDADFDAAVALVREQGALIALDDFGAGHSNFDRVWRLRPEIVKLDRSLVARASAEPRARRVVTQMVSLLHECGALVLMEGVETEAEAQLALQADVDLVQGYFFARPQPELVAAGHGREAIDRLWFAVGDRWQHDDAAYRDRVQPYQQAIEAVAAGLAAGASFERAARNFCALPNAELCYLLDDSGRQIGMNDHGAQAAVPGGLAYAPERDTRGACWASRPYFRRAMAAFGEVQVCRPYRTMHGGHLVETASIAFRNQHDGAVRVVCGDFSWL